jgi:hypothetical protein
MPAPVAMRMTLVSLLAAAASLAVLSFVPSAAASPPNPQLWMGCSVTVNNGAGESCYVGGFHEAEGASCGTTDCTNLYLHCWFSSGPGPAYPPRCT